MHLHVQISNPSRLVTVHLQTLVWNTYLSGSLHRYYAYLRMFKIVSKMKTSKTTYTWGNHCIAETARTLEQTVVCPAVHTVRVIR